MTSDAGDIVSRENRFNKPPEDGRQFFMVRVALTYLGPDSDTAISVALESVGASNVVYSDSRDSCGVIPKPIRDGGRVFTGGAVEGNVCWSIRRQDADSLLLLAHRLFGGRDEVYFALH